MMFLANRLRGVGSEKKLEFSFVTSVGSNANATAYSFPETPLGPTGSGRLIVITYGGGAESTGRDLNSITLNGVEMTRIVQGQGSFENTSSSIWAVENSTDTVGDIVVTHSGGGTSRLALGIYQIMGASTSSAFDTQNPATGSSPRFATIATKKGGVVIACARITATPDFSWSGVYEDYDRAQETNKFSGGSAGNTPEGSFNVTVSCPHSNPVSLAVASWAP